MVQFCRKLAVLLLSSFVLVLIAELVARAAEPGPMKLVDESPYLKSATLTHVHRRNARVQWDGSSYEINSRGWRGPEYEPTFEPSELRVVAIGDSCTFGKAVEESESWPRQFERLLQAHFGSARQVRVANLGVNGYSGRDYLETFLTQALPLRPHLVIVGYNINDFPNVVKKVDAAVFQNQENLRSHVSYDLRLQLSRLASFRWLRASYYDWNRERDLARVEQVAKSVEDAHNTSPEALADEAARLRRIVDECAALDARVALFLFPYESQVYLPEFSSAPLDGARSIAEPLGIGYLDLVELFRAEARSQDPWKRLFIRGDRYHPNAEGYRLVAEGVFADLKRRGWISER